MKEDFGMIALPKRTIEELKKLKKDEFQYEPYYHIIGRLIVEHKERV